MNANYVPYNYIKLWYYNIRETLALPLVKTLTSPNADFIKYHRINLFVNNTNFLMN